MPGWGDGVWGSGRRRPRLGRPPSGPRPRQPPSRMEGMRCVWGDLRGSEILQMRVWSALIR